jgi:hypothetical protein
MKKNKKLHFFSVLLILAMAFMTIATSVSTPPYRKRLSYDIFGEYLHIQINTVQDQNKYILLNGSIKIHFIFGDWRNNQTFTNNYFDKRYIIEISSYNFWWGTTTEEIQMDEPLFAIYIENDFLVLKLAKSLIKENNFKLDYISFQSIEENWYEQYK